MNATTFSACISPRRYAVVPDARQDETNAFEEAVLFRGWLSRGRITQPRFAGIWQASPNLYLAIPHDHSWDGATLFPASHGEWYKEMR